MTKGLQQSQFITFAIILKGVHSNSVMIGSISEISKKSGLTDYQTRKLINYGVRIGLISRLKKRFIIASYKRIFETFGTLKYYKHIHFYKKGTFNELVEKNLFAIAKLNFNQQLFRGSQSKRIRMIKKLVTVNTQVKGVLTKSEYTFYCKNKHRVLGRDHIVSGQKHLAKLLNISQGLAALLLKRWSELKLIGRELIYSSCFDYNYSPYALNTAIPLICKGSKITLTCK